MEKFKKNARTFTVWVYILTGAAFIAIPTIDALVFKPHLTQSQVITTNWPLFLIGVLTMLNAYLLSNKS